ncbi:winged helix-turn-helix domain-containing protein [Brevundimonas sp. 2R-24]|uniref:Winged helix-turn-helix domain-containing protein n=1 Tax=Peiella sedimenti TaxID=3061083 RepID=A0ABT8SNY6_9CAUL|nr:winged helix-turn-helix domain-containing protein [Caulobacteraceae bacterium XZ-24]
MDTSLPTDDQPLPTGEGEPTPIVVGDWVFDPGANTLEKASGERRRLEDRAARTLLLLAQRRGRFVGQDEIVARVWNKRALSPNSVAMVIRDLRRALDDDARNPRHIETAPKKGYRLTDPSAPPLGAAMGAERRIGSLTMLVSAAAAVVMVWAAVAAIGPSPVEVRVVPVTNATGQSGLNPLTVSVTGLMRADLSDEARIRLTERGDDAIVVTGEMVIWTGHPAVGLTATDPRTGQILWSGMASGPEPMLPRQVRAEMQELGQLLREGENEKG